MGTRIHSELHDGVSYDLERVLGEGGTAVAYFALRTGPGGTSPAVVKIVLPSFVMQAADTAAMVIRKEAVALGRLNERVPPSPYVVRLLDVGSAPFMTAKGSIQLPWLALEYVSGGAEGTTLEDRVEHSMKATGFAFDPVRAARAIDSLARGLDEVHAVGVVHRDITPGNVLCCGSAESELFKISDFGIARPLGVSATFGSVMLGTVGYAAPEQMFGGDVPVSAYSDLFSLAAVVFFMLTGEHYFEHTTPAAALMDVRSDKRRSLLDVPTLPFELREREPACQAIDLALARATSLDPALRPKSARAFADSILPWVGGITQSLRPSARWLGSLDRLHTVSPAEQVTWLVRHPTGDDRIVRSSAWNGAGDCLAATPEGLVYWNGTSWLPAPTASLRAPRGLHVVRRLRPVSWVIGGEGATLTEYSSEGVRELFTSPEPGCIFSDISGDLDDLAVVLGARAGSPPLLCCLSGKRWLRSMPAVGARVVTGLARITDERWLLVGSGVDGRGWAALYSPLQWDVAPLPLPECGALLACAARPERGHAVAVGLGGVVLQLSHGEPTCSFIAGRPDLAAVTMDVRGRIWAASRGALWTTREHEPWTPVWRDDTWQAPFTRLHAEMGSVLAMTVDGGVLEGRAGDLGRTLPA